jgi:pimeloyl-ACP methyl ester carboxylesterase
MANYLLVHGAWHGGWCWRRVAQPLTHAGHRAHAVTLTGLGDRAHLMSRDITLETHIKDVVDTIVCEELTNLILVGHSYAGMLITAVADRLPELVKYLVYVDAVIPKPGESWSSTHAPATREARIKAIEHDPQHSLPPPDPSVYGLAEDDYRWAQRRQTPHPGATYEATLDFDAQRVGAIPHTFVNCVAPALATIDPMRHRAADPTLWGGAWLLNARMEELQTGHDPMISAPEDLTDILLDCAERIGADEA